MTQAEKMFLVIDSSCTAEGKPRIHDILVDGHFERIVFKYGEPTLLPYHKAVKFMLDGFTVKDADTDSTLHNPSVTDETVRIRIGADEIVAKYEELEMTALKIRAGKMVGGEVYITKKASKAELIAFIKAANAPAIDEDEESLIDDSDDEDGVVLKIDPEYESIPLSDIPDAGLTVVVVADGAETSPLDVGAPEPVAVAETPAPVVGEVKEKGK